MFLFALSELAFPIENPVIKFLIILSIILFAPLILNKLRIPHILGLIVAGAIIGPNGFNLILRDSSIILSGTAGLLYIMFLAGLEIDLNDFKKNSKKSLLFGMYTFLIPMTLGIFTGLYILKFSMITSVLLASMFASHTLISYPIITKLGITRNRAVTVTVGGTMITDTLALLVLAVIVGMTQGTVDSAFWIRLIISMFIFGGIVLGIFPLIARFFFKHCSDSISQYIFVLFMVFLGAVLAEMAGIEAIIGAFLSGLALNRLIPHSSPLMNRIEFIGNAIFIPFFLIGVGMLVNYRVFLSDTNTIFVAFIMTCVATISKYLAALFAQKSFGYNKDERSIIFGLSNAQAAATLAAVLVGFNIILGYNPDGTPIRLLNESVLNGTIIMIFVTCTIATFAAQRGAYNLTTKDEYRFARSTKMNFDKILIPISNPKSVEELISLGNALSYSSNIDSMYVANIIDNTKEEEKQLELANKIFDNAKMYAAATDHQINSLLRYDISSTNGILGLIKENKINDLILGMNTDQFLHKSTLGMLIDKIILNSNVSSYIYKSYQPLSTISRYIIVIPAKAEEELGFLFWLKRIWALIRNTGTTLVVYSSDATREAMCRFNEDSPISIEFHTLNSYDDLLIIAKEVRKEDGLIFIMSRKHNISYSENMEKVPHYIDTYFSNHNFILLYPMQQNAFLGEVNEFVNKSNVSTVNKLDDFTGYIFKKVKPNKEE
ncbi:MAG: cation:proton antiporter [Bacteroidales bacterium]